MFFRNRSPNILSFTIDGQPYWIAPSERVEIPDHLAYVVGSRGLLLTEDNAPALRDDGSLDYQVLAEALGTTPEKLKIEMRSTKRKKS